MKTLKEVACGKTVTVKKITGEGPVKRRIMDMGITKGVEVFVRKVAPLGDPVEVTVRGYELSLRKADAEIPPEERLGIALVFLSDGMPLRVGCGFLRVG